MPTPAPDRATLYNVAYPVESAIKALFVAGSVADVIGVQRETCNLKDSRVDVRVEIGGNYAHRDYAWSATAIASVWTDRSVDAPEVHGQRCGAIIAALPRVPCGEPFHPIFSEEILPYHVINWIEHASSDPQVSITDDLDLSEMRFSLVISVRPGCFPVVIDTP